MGCSKFLLGFLVGVFVFVGFVSAFEYNGTVYDISGNALNNTLINISIQNVDFSYNSSNFTYTNESGWFNLSVTSINGAFYQQVITYTNPNTNYVQYIGSSLPAFPEMMLRDVAGTTFYLREAGTINITAINKSGARIPFKYQIKDQKLGYSIASNLDSSSNVNETVVYVPRDRNYSLMIYPDQSMPVSFDWNNLSASGSYNLSVLSKYNFTTKTLQYQFNTTMSMKRVSGFLDYTLNGWDEFTIVPYLLEPGNMIHSTFGDMPYNLSGFEGGGTDFYDLTTGFYNVSLPGTAETSNIMLFATARKGSQYVGGFKNLSLTTSSSAETTAFNFTNLAGLLGPPANISMDTLSGGSVNITTAKQTFNLVNASNSGLSGFNAHIETIVDYSSLGSIEFTWMSDIGQGASSSFSILLLNNTDVKEMNFFVGGGNYAPKRLSPTIVSLITDNNANGNESNVTIKSFNPGAIDSVLASSDITMGLYISNATCDVPNPASSCTVGSSTDMGDFNPMSALIGGGKLSFRMGTGNISVHYVNVDMLASGPPDALFDNNNTDSGSSSSFDQAVRFGSGGPTIYDYILVSIPYAEVEGSGLNDSAEVNMTLPLLYDDDWNIIWNATANGTDVGVLAGNYSHYSARQSEWSQLLNQTTCTTSAIIIAPQINATSPCYIDATLNKVWIRLPQFSGAGPSVTGSVLATPTSDSSSPPSSPSGSGTITASFWKNTFAYDSKDLDEKESLTREYKKGNRVRIKIDGEKHYVGVVELTGNSATINVSSTTQQATLSIGEEKKFDVSENDFYDILVKLEGISNSKANITISSINEAVPLTEGGGETASGGENGTAGGEGGVVGSEGVKRSSSGWWIILAIAILAVLGGGYYFWNKR